MSWGENLQNSTNGGQSQMEVRSKITNGKLLSWEIRKGELLSFYDVKLSIKQDFINLFYLKRSVLI